MEYNSKKIEELLKQVLGERFLGLFIIPIVKRKHIRLLVKATEEFEWGYYCSVEDDAVTKYLQDVGYSDIDILVSTAFEGEWVK